MSVSGKGEGKPFADVKYGSHLVARHDGGRGRGVGNDKGEGNE